ncbi:PPOX class F420-dependent oxidoreductase [Ktedonosporobacter rubrisoli]|uniref:PPOX class F420-dependent oxidoreductase n=1 Tax=Ktedonosporobacter rubrisoli TaxID=2509675 RepID=A0A4P6JW72_KTERU|nr:PPOX class F420-dependent oxidoreductase [Ktedonosporobacter rubrisoli]QBD79622.1 PPOX class F420-dependent oxidoreductase [Ktedonosporobacter rubrisoli]
MAHILSAWAKEFLREARLAVVSTLNKDGSSHLASVWYMLADDGTLVLTTGGHSQKARNLRRDPRIALCVGEANRSVSLYGTVTISEDQTRVRQDLERLLEHYMKDAGLRQQALTGLLQRSPIVLHFRPEKVTEFAGMA